MGYLGALTFNLLRLLQKITEIVFFGEWQFSVKCKVPAWSGCLRDRLMPLLTTWNTRLLLPLVNANEKEDVSLILTSFAQKSLIRLLYTSARALLAIGRLFTCNIERRDSYCTLIFYDCFIDLFSQHLPEFKMRANKVQ